MTSSDNILSFQIKYGAVLLPKIRSQAFVNTYYGNGNVDYMTVVWLNHQTAKHLCAKHLATIEGHFRMDYPGHVRRSYCPPSERLPLASADYYRGQILFTNGLHRTRTFLEGGAPFVPFDMNIKSFIELQRDGHHFAAYEHSIEFEKRLRPMLNFSWGAMDPFVPTYRQNFPKPMKLDDAIKSSRLFFKLLGLELASRTKLRSLIQNKDWDETDDQPLRDAQWHFDSLKIVIPALMSMRDQGLTRWPENVGFPGLFPQPNRSAEDDAREWAKLLPVPVVLEKIYRPKHGVNFGT